MKEQFVTYEIALKLKELGFNEKCFGYFGIQNEVEIEISYNSDLNLIRRNFISAPLWQQVIDWFKEKYNIWIIVDTSLIKFYKDDQLLPPKFQFVIEDLINRDNDYLFHSADEELFYFDYKEARNSAILKTIELCQKKQ